MHKKYVIIVAGGTGNRMNDPLPKQFHLLDGRPVLMHTIDKFATATSSPEIILVLHEQMHHLWQELCLRFNFQTPHSITYGGKTRFQSVKNGLLNIVEQENQSLSEVLIAIHDAARPIIAPSLIDRCFEEAAAHGATVLAVPSTNSIRIGSTEQNSSIEREKIWLVQTPQTFRADILQQAFQQEELPEFTDDASVVEKSGYPIKLIAGDYRNIKITFPEDLFIAKYYLASLNND